MSKLQITYDQQQHATVKLESHGKRLSASACPSAGGKGDEFSPGDLVAAGLASCMLFSMGLPALRDELDLAGLSVDVDSSLLDGRIEAIDLTFQMPRGLSSKKRSKLERAAAACPIKSSFHPDVRITLCFAYPEEV